MRKYDINVCKCGVIHAIPNEKIEKALKKQKPLLTICGNCGVASLRGGDEDVDFDGNPCYMMYRRDFTYNDSESINKDNIDQYSEVYYDKGYKVMMNGALALTGVGVCMPLIMKTEDFQIVGIRNSTKSKDRMLQLMKLWNLLKSTIKTEVLLT